jgi:heme/copper-type cytochrome/quinol oxidase subunit 2
MNDLKKHLGIVWMLLGPAAIAFLVWQAAHKLSGPKATTDAWVQWSIIIFIFTPVAIGMVIFGWYAWKREYEDT